MCKPHHNLILEHLCWPQKKYPLVVTLHYLLSLHQGSHKSLYRFAYSRQCRYMEIFNMRFFCDWFLSPAYCFQGLSMLACIRISLLFMAEWYSIYIYILFIHLFDGHFSCFHINVHSQWQMYEGCNFSTSSNTVFWIGSKCLYTWTEEYYCLQVGIFISINAEFYHAVTKLL